MDPLTILASGSEIRQHLLRNAGVKFTAIRPQVDEGLIKKSLLADNTSPRGIADALAKAKAHKISMKSLDSVVIGCDQVLTLDGVLYDKPIDKQDALTQLLQLNGKSHQLISAVVVYQNAQPQWRHIAMVDMHMRENSRSYISDYVDRNWQSIQHAVGCYKLEEEGSRLFSSVDGDYFTVLGLPLFKLLQYLTTRGILPG